MHFIVPEGILHPKVFILAKILPIWLKLVGYHSPNWLKYIIAKRKHRCNSCPSVFGQCDSLLEMLGAKSHVCHPALVTIMMIP